MCYFINHLSEPKPLRRKEEEEEEEGGEGADAQGRDRSPKQAALRARPRARGMREADRFSRQGRWRESSG